jgi:hypothetical protein
MFSLLVLTQGNSTESPLPLWERDRVRGLAPEGADESLKARADAIASRCRASPLTLSLSHRGRGNPVELPGITYDARSFPLSLVPSSQGEGNFLAR